MKKPAPAREIGTYRRHGGGPHTGTVPGKGVLCKILSRHDALLPPVAVRWILALFIGLLGRGGPGAQAASPKNKQPSPLPHQNPTRPLNTSGPPDKPAEHTAPARLRAAESAQSQRQWALAAQHYEAFLRDFGDHPSAEPVRDFVRCQLLECQLRGEDPSAALATVETLLEHPPKIPPQTAEAWRDLPLLKARLQLHLSKYPAARASFENWLSRVPPASPKNASPEFFAHRDEARLGVATCLLEEGRPAEAADFVDAHARQLVLPRSIHAARVLRIQCALAGQNPLQAWRFLESCHQSLRTQGFAAACDRLLWETACALTGKNEAPSLQAGICCLKLLAPESDVPTQPIPPIPPSPAPMQPQAVAAAAPVLRSPQNEWQRLLAVAALLEKLQRSADCALVLECARTHAPDKAQRESVELRRLHLLEELKRWPELEAGTHELLLQTPAEALVPRILLLRATAEAEQQAYSKACKTLDEIETLHARTPELPHARLLGAHTLLLAGQIPLALARLDQFDALHPKHPLHATALLLRIQALLAQKSYAACQKAVEHFAHRYPRERLTTHAKLHGGLAASARGDHALAAQQARSCLENNPEPDLILHALLLLGRSCARLGDAPGALHALGELLEKAPQDPGPITDSAALETARLLRASHNAAALRTFWKKLLLQRPRCGTLPEITRWVLEESRMEKAPEDPKSLLWNAFDALQNVPRCEAVLPLMNLLAEEYRTSPAEPDLSSQLQQRIPNSRETAPEALPRIHALRARLDLVQPSERADALSEALPLILANLDKTPANILAAVASISEETEHPPGKAPREHTPGAMRLWEELLRWNPRSSEKDRAFLAIGCAAAKRGDLPAASEAFGRALRECPDSDLLPRIRLERSRLCLEVNTPEEAERDLHAVLAHPRAAARLKADALVLLGEKHMRAPEPAKAIACFQRVYILYPACDEAVAAAYLRSGEAFEMLNDPQAARRTYSELLSLARLHALPQCERARKKLQSLPP